MVDAGSSTTQLAVQQLLRALSSARSQRVSAEAALTNAKAVLSATEQRYQQASALAETVSRQATVAATTAKASATQFLLAVRGGAGQIGPLDALGGGGTLLQRLGSLDRVNQLDAPPPGIAARAETDAATAQSLRGDARRAAAVARAVPVAAVTADVVDAQATFDAAQLAVDAAASALGSGVAFGVNPVLNADGLLADATWTNPVAGPITDVFGPRPSQPAGTAVFHPGVDIGAACGSVIVAASAGTVDSTGPNGGYGNWVEIDHGDGVQTVYGHIADGETFVHVGEHVVAGQPIAQVGDTGESTGCHLHIEVRVSGSPINPTPFFTARNVVLGR